MIARPHARVAETIEIVASPRACGIACDAGGCDPARVAVDWRQVFKEQGPLRAHVTHRRVRSERGSLATTSDLEIEDWFRAQDSNLRSWVQSPVSFQLDDPGSMMRACLWVRRGSNPRLIG